MKIIICSAFFALGAYALFNITQNPDDLKHWIVVGLSLGAGLGVLAEKINYQ